MKKNSIHIFLMLIFLPCLILISACGNSVDFKINFVVDGSLYYTIETKGNATITMPNDPAKEGYTFDGWYWDKDIWNEPFTANSLLNKPLKKDMSVYAKFINSCAHVDSEWNLINIPTCITNGLEEKVCSLCGESIETRTINATGHTFGSWYVSKPPTITEKGVEKRDCNNCTYSETKDIPKLTIENPTKVNVEFGIIRWDGLSPFGFDVVVNGVSQIVKTNELDTTLKSDDYNEIKVASINPDGTRSEYVELKDFVVNSPITNLHYTDDGMNVTFTWNSPSDLYDYTFIVGESENTVDKDKHSYTIARNSLECDSIVSIYVQGSPSANFFPSKKNTIILRQLDAPVLTIDKLNVSWNKVENADNYKINALTTTTTTSTIYSYDGVNAGEHTITVTAFGDDYLNNSSTLIFNKLVCPEITIENNVVSWNAIAGQVRYTTFINGVENKIVGNSYTITNIEDEYDIYLYASPVQSNTMQSDRAIISKFTYKEYYTRYYGIQVNDIKTYSHPEISNILYVPIELEDLNFSNINSQVTLVARKCPSTLTKTFVTNIIIPEGVIEIMKSGFEGCTNITSINFPNSLLKIGVNSFYNCTLLNGITIPKSVMSIGNGAFCNCAALKMVTFEDNSGCESIDISAFKGCSNIISMDFPESLLSIGEYAFYNCTSLNNITVPKSVINIGTESFYNCIALEMVTFEENSNCESIGRSAFRGCSSLSEMILPFVGRSAKVINSSSSSLFGYIFGNDSYNDSIRIWQSVSDSSRTDFYIPSRLKKVTILGGGDIPYGAFSSCKMLTNIVIEDGVKIINSCAFCQCLSLTNIVIPKSVINIGTESFYNCTSLELVTFEDNSNCKSIGHSAFRGCSNVVSINIPDSVISIEDAVFYGCGSLMYVYYGGGVDN